MDAPLDEPQKHDQEPAGDAAFERELAELKPRALGAGLTARLEKALEEGLAECERAGQSESEAGARSKIVRFFVPAAAAAAAVALAAVVVLRSGDGGEEGRAKSAAAADKEARAGGLGRLEPVAAENYLLDTRDGDIVLVNGKTPYREVYLDYEDSYHWRDPDRDADVRFFRARTEVVYVPVTVY